MTQDGVREPLERS